MPPPLSIYPPRIQILIHRLNTPRKVQAWLKTLRYNKTETMRTLASVMRFQSAHCLEGALCAAALLEPHGYPPLILDLESTDLLDHTLLLYKHKGKYGSVGKSRDIGLDGRKPAYKTIRALVQSYAIPYIDHQATITGYGVLDLRTLKNTSWRTSTKNVWYVEEALRNISHRNFSLPDRTVKKWRKRYLAFKKKYPGRQPDYYPDQDSWV